MALSQLMLGKTSYFFLNAMHPPEVQADDRPCRRDNLEIQAGDLQKQWLLHDMNSDMVRLLDDSDMCDLWIRYSCSYFSLWWLWNFYVKKDNAGLNDSVESNDDKPWVLGCPSMIGQLLFCSVICGKFWWSLMGIPSLFPRLPSGKLTVCYWKWPFIVSFPIENGYMSFP